MNLLLGLEPFQKLGVVGGWWWSKGILEFHFGPNLELRLEAGTKLNYKSETPTVDFPEHCWNSSQLTIPSMAYKILRLPQENVLITSLKKQVKFVSILL